jgi:hypothetical protein
MICGSGSRNEIAQKCLYCANPTILANVTMPDQTAGRIPVHSMVRAAIIAQG